MGGSAAVGILLVSAIPGRAAAAGALVLFAAATAVSMAVLSTTLGRALVRGPVARRLVRAAPALGFASLAFGAWYALAGVGALPGVLG